ncbi:hypothetical protein GCM10009662_53720 [Catellatospora coxensis]
MGVLGDLDESAERNDLDYLAYQDVTGVEFFEAGHAITSFLGRLRLAGDDEGGRATGPPGDHGSAGCLI